MLPDSISEIVALLIPLRLANKRWDILRLSLRVLSRAETSTPVFIALRPRSWPRVGLSVKHDQRYTEKPPVLSEIWPEPKIEGC